MDPGPCVDGSGICCCIISRFDTRMIEQARRIYLERNGMACAVCFGPNLELTVKHATAELRKDVACLVVPVKCRTCGWKGQETYSLLDVADYTEEGCREKLTVFEEIKDA